MLDSLRRRWTRFKEGLDPSNAALGRWLAIINVAIVVIGVGGISITAIDLLRDQADAQAKSRVLLAGAGAREELRRVNDSMIVAATSMSTVPATASLPPPSPASRVSAVAPAQASVPAAQILNAQLAANLSRRAGVPVRLIPYRAFLAAPVNEFTGLHSAALADGYSAVQRIRRLDLYAASFPVYSSTGEVLGLIEARLSAAELDAATGKLVRQLLLTAFALALLALLGGMLLGQFVAGPVRALTQAALRLGQGDFSTSIPPQGPAEVGVLARTMEDMRRNLVDLTGTLRRHEAEARAVLAGIVEGVYAVDKSRMIRYLNPQAAKLLGLRADEAVGRFCGDVLKPQPENGRRPCEFNCPIVHARDAGRAQAVERLQRAPDETHTTVITSSGITDDLQVQVIRDETELEAVRRARDSVLANISHEFRTPLAAQLASIELLRDGLDTMTRDQQKALVMSLERGTQRLTRLIDNLLESVRIESGQLGIRMQSLELSDLIDDARVLIGSLLVQRGQTLDVSIPEDLPAFDGDGPRLTQVLVNLLANASKFAPEGSAVRVGAGRRDGTLAVWVEDEGPGLPADAGASIFDRFRRGSDMEPEPGGLGLGLWIAKSIVERHGGAIAVERTGQNRTRFIITLPLEARA